MSENLETYVIVKRMKENGRTLEIILVDSHSEIWEFDDRRKAKEIADILTTNSVSGWLYYVKTTN